MASDGFESVDFPRFLEPKENLLRPKFYTLRLKACCLIVLLGFRENQDNIEDEKLKAVLIHIRTVFLNVYPDLQTLGILSEAYKRTGVHMADWHRDRHRFQHYCILERYDRCSSILERLENLNPDIKQVYDIISKSSRFITGSGMNNEAVMKNINNLLKNIEDLMSCKPELVALVKEELEAAQTSLRFLRNFIGFTAKRCSKLENLKDLVNHAEFQVHSKSCLFYLCSIIDQNWMNQMKMHLSFELKKLSLVQPNVRDLYVKALKVSTSARRDYIALDDFDLGFFYSLRDHIMELSDTKLRFIASDKDQFLSLHEKLRILIISFAKDTPLVVHRDLFRCLDVAFVDPDRVSNYFLKHVNVVIIDMGYLIYSLYNKEKNTEEAKELKTIVSNLQDILETTKEISRKAYDTYIPKCKGSCIKL